MSDSHSEPQQNGRSIDGSRDGGRGGSRGGRGHGNRDTGGFRIRLSDNEMRSARSLQEAFNLRSTVAVLGFALRTLGQMLEEGKLDELVVQHRSQAPRGGNRKEEGGGPGFRKNRFDGDRQGSGRGTPKPNPFARPEKPQPSPTESDQSVEGLNDDVAGDSSEQDLNKSPETEEMPTTSTEEANSTSGDDGQTKNISSEN